MARGISGEGMEEGRPEGGSVGNGLQVSSVRKRVLILDDGIRLSQVSGQLAESFVPVRDHFVVADVGALIVGSVRVLWRC